MLASNGRIVLCDFGMGRILPSEGSPLALAQNGHDGNYAFLCTAVSDCICLRHFAGAIFYFARSFFDAVKQAPHTLQTCKT